MSGHFTRRDFLERTAKAGIAAAGVAAAGFALHDRKGPQPRAPATWALPDFRVPGIAPALAIARGADRGALVDKALDLLGGLDAFVKPGDRVLLKVNAAFASPPALGATTHPDTLRALIRRCRAAGAREIVVADNPINDPVTCFRLSGLAEAAEHEGAKLVLPGRTTFAPCSVAGGRLIRDWPVFAAALAGVTKVIGVAPLKDHHRSGASMTLKNWYGLLGGRRNVFHQDIHGIISELAQLVRPTLVVLDGAMAMMTNGPTGGSLADLKPTRALIAGTDAVAVDALGATLLERKAADLPFLGLAEKAGAGTTDYGALKPREATAG